MRENNGEKSSLSSFICYSDSNESMQDNKKNNLDKKNINLNSEQKQAIIGIL